MPTKAELEAEVGRLRQENENLRYVTACLLDAGRCEQESRRHMADSQQHILNALGCMTAPTIPNN